MYPNIVKLEQNQTIPRALPFSFDISALLPNQPNNKSIMTGGGFSDVTSKPRIYDLC